MCLCVHRKDMFAWLFNKSSPEEGTFGVGPLWE